jgi:hypothetical protein
LAQPVYLILPIASNSGKQFFTLREEHRFKILQGSLLRISGPETVEITGRRRKLHYEQLRNLYSSRNVVRIVESGTRDIDAFCIHGEDAGYRIFAGIKLQLGRSRNILKDIIKIDIKEIKYKEVDSIHLRQNRDRL